MVPPTFVPGERTIATDSSERHTQTPVICPFAPRKLNDDCKTPPVVYDKIPPVVCDKTPPVVCNKTPPVVCDKHEPKSPLLFPTLIDSSMKLQSIEEEL